jgi:F-type H+-transporting ATPase subunit b
MGKIGIYYGTALAVMTAAVPAWADEAAHTSDGALPQFRTEFYAGELFWLTVAFGTLYLLMKHVALPKIAMVQDTRNAQRQADLTAAAAANDAAKQAMAAYEKNLADARAQAQTQLSQIVATAQQEAATAARQQQQALDARMTAAQAKIDANLLQALAHVRETAVTTTGAILQHLTGSAAEAAAAQAVDQVSQRHSSAA